MARYMKVVGGVAINAEDWPSQPSAQGATYVASSTANVGDTYANGVFTPGPVTVPLVVSMMQAQLALQAAGKLSAVNTAVAGADANTQIYWNTATALHRDHPVVAALGAAVGLSSAQIDALFVAASGLF